MGGRFRAALRVAVEAFFPHACVGCGVEGALVCGVCVDERFGPLKGTFSCPGCGKRVGGGFGRCGERVCERGALDGHFSVGSYGDPALRELLRAWKYERVPEAGEIISDLCWRSGKRHQAVFTMVESGDVRGGHGVSLGGVSTVAVVAVPIHPIREALRGFDQSRVLGEAFAAGAGLRYAPDVLGARLRWRTQVGVSDPEARRRNARESVLVVGKVPRYVVLVDDVLTTGATMDACAVALREAGAEWVVGVTFLRG